MPLKTQCAALIYKILGKCSLSQGRGVKRLRCQRFLNIEVIFTSDLNLAPGQLVVDPGPDHISNNVTPHLEPLTTNMKHSVRNLGVVFDQYLNFNQHINSLQSVQFKFNPAIYIISQKYCKSHLYYL